MMLAWAYLTANLALAYEAAGDPETQAIDG